MNRLLDFLRRFFRRAPAPRFVRIVAVPELPDVPEILDPHAIYVAGTPALPKWAVLLCPCDAPHVVTLSLQPTHRFRWRAEAGRRGPTISPSIDVMGERRCHYWVRNGAVTWVRDLWDRDTA